MTTLLAIDTSSFAYAAVLGRDGAVLASASHDDAADRTRQLIAVIDEVLGESRGSLSAIAVIVGPGSYAGLRVGISTAQGLALALGIPVLGVSTFDAVQHVSGLRDGLLIHPAGRGQFACQAVAGGELHAGFEVRDPADLSGATAGERASSVGGTEVRAMDRAMAALSLATARVERGDIVSGADAIYLREPHITVSRRKQTAQTTGE